MIKLRRLGVLLGAAALAAVPVGLATAQTTAPTVVTSPATGASDTAATLNGSVNSSGSATNYAFQWGPTNGYGHETMLTSAGSGTTASAVNATVNGLVPGTTYHFRIIAINDGGTAAGTDQTFNTTGTAPAPSTPPTASTGAATNVGQIGATVNGTVNPAGQATTYYFEYGPTSNYGFETSATSGGSGSTDEPASANLTGLSSGTAYHYRLVAVSPGGTTLGAEQTFTTSAAPQSQVAFIGREGFVSPGRIIGVEAGCFGGTTNCTGTVSLSRNGIVLGQTNYNIAPNSGGFVNMELSSQGGQMLLAYNRLFHLLPVVATITPTSGQPISHVFHLARWIWH